ncbi:MAG: hypothetical protein NVS2B8_06940 [Vulcanimicrobiaceae bacterium]
MHNERVDSEPVDDDVEREAVVAADDTGLVAQQHVLANVGIGDVASSDEPGEI